MGKPPQCGWGRAFLWGQGEPGCGRCGSVSRPPLVLRRGEVHRSGGGNRGALPGALAVVGHRRFVPYICLVVYFCSKKQITY